MTPWNLAMQGFTAFLLTLRIALHPFLYEPALHRLRIINFRCYPLTPRDMLCRQTVHFSSTYPCSKTRATRDKEYGGVLVCIFSSIFLLINTSNVSSRAQAEGQKSVAANVRNLRCRQKMDISGKPVWEKVTYIRSLQCSLYRVPLPI